MRNPSWWEDPPEDPPEAPFPGEEVPDVEPDDLHWDIPNYAPFNRDPVDYVYDPFKRYDNV